MNNMTERIQLIHPTEQVTSYENGLLYSVYIQNDESVAQFLAKGGVTTSDEMQDFVFSVIGKEELKRIAEATKMLRPEAGGCSVLSVRAEDDGYLFEEQAERGL